MINEQMIAIVLQGFSTLGIVVFAISGALFAAEKRMDILSFILVGTVTAIGGGTLRDLLLGVSPVGWVSNPGAIYLAVVASILTYFSVGLFRNRDAWILWMDAIGLSAFAVLGAQVATAAVVPPIIAVVMDVMSATFGGIMRDVLCAEVLTLMRPEMYITCALLASFLFVVLDYAGLQSDWAAAVAFAGGLGLRSAAILFKLTLPKFSY